MKLPLPIAPLKTRKTVNSAANLNKKLQLASKAFRSALAKNKIEEAYQHIFTAFKLVPTHPVILMDLAYIELKLARLEQAYQHYLQAIKYSGEKVDANIYDGLTEVCYLLGNQSALQKYGQLAIQTKKNNVAEYPKVKEILDFPPSLNPNNPEENIIAYSLFGSSPRYCETSIINVDLAKEIYPEFICRFYVDQTVPEQVRERLEAKGAQVIMVTDQQKQLSGLFWRMLVMDDPCVKCFLIRDADSLVSYRERAAVDEWLGSGKWFHCMRDYYSHTELVLAGMWGGFNGIFDNVDLHIREYIQTGNYLTTRVMDQHYLRYCIWPTIQQSVLIHDSLGFDQEALGFPSYARQTHFEEISHFHVGMNEGSSQVYAAVTIPDAQHVDWVIQNELGHEVCRYTAQVLADAQILIELPQIYASKLETQEWKLHIHLAQNTD